MVEVGLTVVEPDAATVPMPLSMETAVAFEVVQVSVAWFPGVTVEGETERVAVVTAGGNEGSSAAPRQPDMRPSERHTAMNDKHLVGKRTLRHPLGPWHEPWQKYEIKPGRTQIPTRVRMHLPVREMLPVRTNSATRNGWLGNREAVT